jgi:transcription initiation factor TFIIE subunit alpha
VAWVKQHIQESAQQRSGEATTGDGLKIAGSTPGQHKDDGIAIEMATDKDEATRRRERQEAAEAKRQQNLLPSWHLKSTISGDLTALGIAESARNAEAAAVTAPSSNEDILRSLGAKSLQRNMEQPYLEVKQEDVKPVISQQQRDNDCKLLSPSLFHLPESLMLFLVYDQYYASLAASSQPTPILETGGSDFGEDEEDVKPSIEYLNSLNEYRKRSRSTEDVGLPTSNSGKKIAKHGYENPRTGPIIASTTPMLEALVKEQPLDAEVPPLHAQDPVVYGTQLRFISMTVSFVLTCDFPT